MELSKLKDLKKKLTDLKEQAYRESVDPRVPKREKLIRFGKSKGLDEAMKILNKIIQEEKSW